MIKVLYNPESNNHGGEENIRVLKELYRNDEVEFIKVWDVADYRELLSETSNVDLLVLAGGDGTLNHFVNDIDSIAVDVPVFLYACGSGNDFLHDVKEKDDDNLISINDYIKNLPSVTVKGKTQKFINGIGYGIDGYCCEVGDIQRQKSKKAVNYTSIAIKGLLFHYKPVNAKITVDGETREYKKVWLAPTMKGRFYGGGMMITPNQKREDQKGLVTSAVMFGTGKLKTLIVFPKIFSGEHLKHTEMFEVRQGKNVKVEFDRPVALQIDGETILDVMEYTVNA